MSNKKLIRNIIIAVVVIGALVGLLLFVQNYDPDKAGGSPSPTAAPQISLFSVDSDSISKIAVTNPDGDYTLVKDGDKWVVEGKPEITLNQSKVDSVAMSCASISADQKLEDNPTDLAQYGLDAPKKTITVTAGDQTVTVRMGDGGAGNTVCYAQVGDDPAVYTLYYSKMDSVAPALSTLRDTNIFTMNNEAVRKVTVRADGKPDLTLEAVIDKDENGEDVVSDWKMTAPYDKPIDPQKATETVTNYAKSLSAKEVVSDVADGAAKSKYGFDSPRGSMTMTDKDGVTVTLVVGGKMRDEAAEYAYVMTEGGNKIFKVQEADVAFLKADAKSIVQKFIHLQNIDEVSSVVVTAGGKEYNMTISGEGDNVSYQINGKTIEESPFKKAYQAVIGILFDGDYAGTPSGEAACTVVYHLKDGSAVNIRYVNATDRQYAAVVDGKAEYTVKKKDIDTMIESIELAVNG